MNNPVYIYIYIYITRLASNEIFSPSNKIHRETGRAKDLSAPRVRPSHHTSYPPCLPHPLSDEEYTLFSHLLTSTAVHPV